MLMKIMDERLYSNLTPDHWGITTSLHKRHKLGCIILQKRPFQFEETVVLPLKWHLYFNDVMNENDLHETAANLFPEDTTLHLPFLHTPSGRTLVSFLAAVRNSGIFFQRNVCRFFKGIKLLLVLPLIIGTEAKCPRRPIATEFTNYMYMF